MHGRRIDRINRTGGGRRSGTIRATGRSSIRCLALVLLVLFFLFIVDNTLTNLRSRGIASGFGFLNSTAGFGINQTLIPYTEESTYGRVFLVGLLNTLLVSFVGVIFATILGFLIGIARLSSNWLIAKLASVYIEIFRNIPLLLQILFWFTAVLASLPRTRDGLEFFGVAFLNVRGLYLPRPVPESGFGFVTIAFLIGIARHDCHAALGQEAPGGDG